MSIERLRNRKNDVQVTWNDT